MNEPQYYIAQGQDVQGPFTAAKIRAYIRAGRVRKEMMFSRDGGPWVAGSEIPELFPAAQASPPPLPAQPPDTEAGFFPPHSTSAPAARRPAPAARRAAPAARRARGNVEGENQARYGARKASPRRARVAERRARGTPSGFLTASIMDFVFGGLGMAGGAYVAMISSAAIEAVESNPEMMLRAWANPDLVEQLEALVTMGWIFVAAGFVSVVMAIVVRSGTPEARTGQFVVSFACMGLCVWAMTQGWIGVITLLGFAAHAAAAFIMFQLKPAAPGGGRAAPERRRRRR